MADTVRWLLQTTQPDRKPLGPVYGPTSLFESFESCL